MTNEFLDDLFGDHEGVVYSPIKGEVWNQHFFEWPRQRLDLESHLEDFVERDVYISPVLFKAKKITPENFLGTQFLWTEFDGKLPTSGEIIEPTIRVASSIEGHEHWYWKLDTFLDNKTIVEDLTRRIAYHYGADLSVWDYQNVLRPPDTWNHKRNKPVVIKSRTNTTYNIEKFLWIPIPAAGLKVDITLSDLPDKAKILAKYAWKENTLDLLFKEEVATGKRSDSLVRLAYDLVEAGLSNEEAFVLLEDRDSVWGKYVGRSDRQKRLEGFISYVRGNKAKQAEVKPESNGVFRFQDFMNVDVKLEWVIKGVLPVAGSLVMVGEPGVGKSTLALRLGMSIALQKPFLQMPVLRRQNVLFISLEMQHYELKAFFEDMDLPSEDRESLQQQFFLWPLGYAYPLDVADQQAELLKFIKLYDIKLIIIDSLSLAMYGSVNEDNDVKRLNSFLNEDVRSKLGCSYILIHHPRKQGLENPKKHIDQNDIFGSRFIGANAQTLIALSSTRGSAKIRLEFLKTRLSLGSSTLTLERTKDRGFALESSRTHGVQSPKPTEARPALGKLFGV